MIKVDPSGQEKIQKPRELVKEFVDRKVLRNHALGRRFQAIRYNSIPKMEFGKISFRLKRAE